MRIDNMPLDLKVFTQSHDAMLILEKLEESVGLVSHTEPLPLNLF